MYAVYEPDKNVCKRLISYMPKRGRG